MKLSIITVNHNNAKGLERTIKSVVEQTFKDSEYILIDGASTDESIDIIKNYTDKITYWTNEPDNGIYHAMNKGIKKAIGDYCLFLNSGDYLVNKDILSTIQSQLVDYDFVYGNINVYDSKSYYLIKYPQNLSLKDFYYKSIPHSGGTFIKRDLFNKYGFYNENYNIVSDWEFFIKVIILNNASVKHINETISYFNLNGISTNQLELMNVERVTVLESLIPQRILYDYKEYFKERDLSNLYTIVKKVSNYKLSKFLLKILYNSVVYYQKLNKINPNDTLQEN